MTHGLRIVAPHFCAGVEFNPNTHLVTRCAPILSYMRGWHEHRVRAYCLKQGFTLTLHTSPQLDLL